VSELRFPWLELAVLIPLLAAGWVSRLQSSTAARHWAVVYGCATLATTAAAWLDFASLHVAEAGRGVLRLDPFSAPLLPLTALLYLLTAMATVGAKVQRFSFSRMLVSQAVVLAALSTKEPWLVVILLSFETVFPCLELRARAKRIRVFTLYMLLFMGLLFTGQTLLAASGGKAMAVSWAVLLLSGAVVIRTGLAPAHCWMTDLFEHASFGTSLLFVTPLMGAYAAVRLVLPVAGDNVLHGIGWLALATAVYAAGMALVQKEARRFFCYLLLSHSALVLVGLGAATPVGLTGALCVWLSVSLSLTGLGVSLRALEARHRRLSLTSFRGLYEHAPALAVCFLLTGLASVGFPGTFGFWSNELLVDGAVATYAYMGVAVIVAAALSGIAIVKVYFLLFTGTRHVSTVPLRIGRRERIAVLLLAALILGGGVFPQPGVQSRHDAATQLLKVKQRAVSRCFNATGDLRGVLARRTVSREHRLTNPWAALIRAGKPVVEDSVVALYRYAADVVSSSGFPFSACAGFIRRQRLSPRFRSTPSSTDSLTPRN
jgi:NADH-quinone oxidoreductase subunit M